MSSFVDVGYAAAAAVTTALACLVLMPLAWRHKLLDVPSGRHDHARPTPLVGGLAIFGGLLAIALLRGHLGPGFIAYLCAAALLVAVGVVDDRIDLSWRLRIVVQACAGLILAAGGVQAASVGHLFAFGSWSIPFSVLATVGTINAINMIDGSDGLAGSLVLIALGFFVFVAAGAGDAALAGNLLLIAGAVAGFLVFNLRRPGLPAARLFLGNSGSALLGLTVVWAAFSLARIPGNAEAGIAAPWIVAIPLLDCVVVMTRRLLAGRSPFGADRNHLHHLLRDAGYTPQQIVGYCALAALTAGAAVLAWLEQTGAELAAVLAFFGLLLLHYLATRRRERAVAWLRRGAGPQPEADYPLSEQRLPLRRR
ncbi:MraY family glycosyltransferase [Tahibacter caeni]|uniref:MraY family glycosyltransferase n=1 Tax=Tahibacter caeni TaxID=1453545 RepID=UPI002148A583|nr:MraY family glycosyltransferase [Tahibacter caeni]